jgi:hypothetical protein
MTVGQKNQYLKLNYLFWGRKNLIRLNEKPTGNWSLEFVQWNGNENGLRKGSFERKKTRHTFPASNRNTGRIC